MSNESNGAGIYMNNYNGIAVGLQINQPATGTGRGILINGSTSNGTAIRATSKSYALDAEGFGNDAAVTAKNSGTGNGVNAVATSAGTVGVLGQSTTGTGVWGTATSAGTGVLGTGPNGVRGAAGSGTGVEGSSDDGYGMKATGFTSGIYAHSTSTTSGFGAEAYADNGTGLKARGLIYGVIAQSFTSNPNEAAVYASTIDGTGLNANTDNGRAIVAGSTNAGGVEITAPQYHVRMLNESSRAAPTADTKAHNAGDLVETSAGELWLCVANGTPGQWRKLGGPATAGAFHVLNAPVRVYDSRPGTAPSTGPKTPLTGNRTLDLKGNSSGVPSGAIAVMVNLLLINATNGGGNFTVWANGATKPAANTLVWGGSAGRFSTLAVTKVDSLARCQLNASLSTDIVVDVVGYYR